MEEKNINFKMERVTVSNSFKILLLVVMVATCGGLSVIGGFLFNFQKNNEIALKQIDNNYKTLEFKYSELTKEFKDAKVKETKRTLPWAKVVINTSKNQEELSQVVGNIEVYNDNLDKDVYPDGFRKDMKELIEKYEFKKNILPD